MVATRGRTFKRPWRRSCLSSKLKSSSAPIGRKDSWCFHAVGSSNAPLLGSTAAEGLPRIGRTSIATRWRSCGLPQSASCCENFVIPPDVFGQTLRVEPAASMSFDIAADRYWMEVGQHSKETDLEVNIARLVEWIGANTPLAEIHDDLLAHVVARRRGEPRRANPKFGLVSAATVNRTVTQLLRRILTRARKK